MVNAGLGNFSSIDKVKGFKDPEDGCHRIQILKLVIFLKRNRIH